MNIMILTGNFGMGHTSAANAVAEKIRTEFENDNVYVVDLFENVFNTPFYNIPFHLMINRGKIFYNQVYRRTEDTGRKKRVPFSGHLCQSLETLIVNTGANMIISTLWSCSQIVSDYKRTTGSGIPLITYITDVVSHNEWIQPGTDFYMVAAPKVRDELIKKGVDAKHIMVSGIPVQNAFAACEKKAETKEEKRLLIMGGGLGLLPKSKSFYEGINRLPDVKTTIITGNNSSLYNALYGYYENIEVLGFVSNVYEYMKNATLIISKPGGLTLFEAINSELPLLIFCPFLEQETRNGEFLCENGLGETLPKEQPLWTKKISSILGDDERLNNIRANMRCFKELLDENALYSLIEYYEMQSVSVCS